MCAMWWARRRFYVMYQSLLDLCLQKNSVILYNNYYNYTYILYTGI